MTWSPKTNVFFWSHSIMKPFHYFGCKERQIFILALDVHLFNQCHDIWIDNQIEYEIHEWNGSYLRLGIKWKHQTIFVTKSVKFSKYFTFQLKFIWKYSKQREMRDEMSVRFMKFLENHKTENLNNSAHH